MPWLRNRTPRPAAAPDAEAPRGPERNAGVSGAHRQVAGQVADGGPPAYGETAGVSYEAPGLARPDQTPAVTSFAGPGIPQTASPALPDAALPDALPPDPVPPDPVPPEGELTGIDDLLNEASPAADPLLDAEPAVPQGSQPPVAALRPVSSGTGWRSTGPFRIKGVSDSGTARSGDPQPWRARDLSVDLPMQFWRSRLLIMVLVFVMFAIIANWVIGLTLAIIAGIADTILRAPKAVPLPPGVKLDPAQRRTQRQLAGMGRRGYRVLHRRPIPNSPEFIDHLVIGPSGVYAIDSEKWNKSLPVRTRNGKQLWLGPESKKGRLLHAHWEAQQASELLSARLGQEIVVQPAMAVYGPKIPWDIAVIRDVDVFSGDRLRKYLHKRSRLRERPRLSDSEIERICHAAESVLPVTGTAEQATPVG